MIDLEKNHQIFSSGNSQKKFKDKCSYPEETSLKIKTIFKNYFKETDFNLETISLKSPFNDIWSTLNLIKKHNQPFLIVGGKGLSKELAEASGFGELMERFQLGYFFNSNPYQQIEFEEFLFTESESVINQNLKYREISEEINPYLPKFNLKNRKYMKFICLKDNNNYLIDYRFLNDGNGGASGNCIEEASIQAICEIFERYAAINILLNSRNCPNIPIEYLSDKTLKLISQFEKAGIGITIKDFSLGKKIPVVGILFKYNDFNELELKVGSATSIDVAVERCLTELLQVVGLSVMKKNIRSSKLSEILSGHIARIKDHFRKANSLYKIFPQIKHFLPYHAFISFRFPRHAFFPNNELMHLMKNEGDFKKWNYFNQDCKKELEILLQLCKKENWNVYFRDFNKLGFPTVKIFIPQLYFGHNEYKINPGLEIQEFRKKLLNDITSISIEDLKILNHPEFLLYCCLNNELITFFGLMYTQKKMINVWTFFALLAKALGDKPISRKYLKQSFLYQNRVDALKFFSKDNRSILNYLKKLLPECLENCYNCAYYSECRFPSLKTLPTALR